MLVALPVDDEALRADGAYGSRVAFSPVAGRRDGGVRGGRRDVEILVHLRGRADVGGAAQGPDAGHALVVGWGGDVDPVRFACILFVASRIASLVGAEGMCERPAQVNVR